MLSSDINAFFVAKVRKAGLLIVLLCACCLCANAQTPDYSKLMVKSQGKAWTQDKSWDYVAGLVAKSVLQYCSQYPVDDTSEQAYSWCRKYADKALNSDGSFVSFGYGSLDNIASGKVLLDIYAHENSLGSKQAIKYKTAADFLYNYLRYEYTRIELDEAVGGFIHKNSYPYQMWLDGLYMGAAFYAQWLHMFAPDDTDGWTDIANQFCILHSHTYDPGLQLNYHGWSALPSDKNSFWARSSEPHKGCSAEFWGRGMGWFFAAVVDVLEYMPQEHPSRAVLVGILHDLCAGLSRWQDPESGVWYQLLRYDSSFVSRGGRHNYLEASASCMFAYAYLKALRLGLVDETYRPVAQKAYEGIIKTFISYNSNGTININSICRSAGLGPSNKKERDGSADYYLDGSDVTVVSNEGKGIGTFILASLEYEMALEASVAEVAAPAPAAVFDKAARRIIINHPAKAEVVVADMAGRILISCTCDSSVDLSALPGGLYVCTVSAPGTPALTLKIAL